VQIVQNQCYRDLLRGLLKELPDGIEGAESNRTGVCQCVGGLLGLLRCVEQLGHESRDLPGCRSHIETDLIERRGFDVASEDLHPGPVRWRTRFLMTATPQNERTLILRYISKSLSAARLPDPRLTPDQHELAGAGQHPVESLAKDLQFARAADDRSVIAVTPVCRIAHLEPILHAGSAATSPRRTDSAAQSIGWWMQVT